MEEIKALLMLEPNDKIALFMEGHLKSDYGKMGFGVLRYAKNPIVAVIDAEFNGNSLREITGIDHSAPIVATVEDAHALGAEVLVLGIAPSGGRIPADWLEVIEKSLHLGLSIVNGLHDLLGDRYKALCRQKINGFGMFASLKAHSHCHSTGSKTRE